MENVALFKNNAFILCTHSLWDLSTNVIPNYAVYYDAVLSF